MNKNFYNVLAWIGLTADITSLGAFIFNGNALQFWSPIWFVGIIISSALFGITLFLFSVGNSKSACEFLPFVAGLYAILACVAFLIVFSNLSSGKIRDFKTYSGSLILTIYPFVVSYIICKMFGNYRIWQLISYCFCLSMLLAFIGVMFKYCINSFSFNLYIFSGEATLLMLICFAFAIFYQET